VEEEDDDAKDRLFRERRMLLGLSVVLLSNQFLGVTVTKALNLWGCISSLRSRSDCLSSVDTSGVELRVIRATAKFYANTQPVPTRPTVRNLQSLCDRLARYFVMRSVRGSFYRQVAAPQRVGMKLQKQYRNTFNSTLHIAHGVELAWRVPLDDPNAVNLLDGVGQREGWITMHSGSVEYGDGTGGRSGAIRVPSQFVERFRSPWLLAVAWTWASTSFVTDYFAPIFIGLLPPAIACEHYIANQMQKRLHPVPSKAAIPSRGAVPF
jgi:hypothetical protein